MVRLIRLKQIKSSQSLGNNNRYGPPILQHSSACCSFLTSPLKTLNLLCPGGQDLNFDKLYPSQIDIPITQYRMTPCYLITKCISYLSHVRCMFICICENTSGSIDYSFWTHEFKSKLTTQQCSPDASWTPVTVSPSLWSRFNSTTLECAHNHALSPTTSFSFFQKVFCHTYCNRVSS